MALLLDETAVYRRPDRVVTVTGSERLAYLHLQLSQHLEAAQPGDVTDFLYLDPKGNALAAGRAVVAADALHLIVPPDVAADFAAALEKFKFLMDVTAVDQADSWAVASVRGPKAADIPGARSQQLTAAPHPDAADHPAPTTGYVVRDRSDGVDLVGPTRWVDERVAALGLSEATLDDWEAWRIGAGLPAWGAEIVPGHRAQELGLLPTHVHLRKGCYPGQESIAKIYNLGRSRRALAVVAAEAPLTAGAPADAHGKPVEITSAAGAVALALVPVDPDGNLPATVTTADGITATVRARVGEGLPQPGADLPAGPRRFTGRGSPPAPSRTGPRA